jgi:hypothetical protein
MTSLETGMLVQHASLGLGKVVAIEPNAVHVAFASQDARFATKLRLPMALSFLTPSPTANARLSAVSGFDLDAKTGRYGRASTFLSHADAVARFTEAFPLAFEDPAYRSAEKGRGARAALWRRAHLAFAEALGDGRGEALLAAGDLAGLAKRASDVERIVRTLHREADRSAFDEGLRDPAAARAFFAALLDLVAAAAPDGPRFDALAAAVAGLAPGAPPESRWPVVTLLPFVARPDVHALLRPHFTLDAAERLGLEVAYQTEPGWATYASLLAASSQLLEKLRPLGARDHVDVEVFIHDATAKQARPKAKAGLPAGGGRARRARHP